MERVFTLRAICQKEQYLIEMDLVAKGNNSQAIDQAAEMRAKQLKSALDAVCKEKCPNGCMGGSDGFDEAVGKAYNQIKQGN